MSLVEILQKININNEVSFLEKVNKILDDSKTVITFWGTRKISYQGKEISFVELARKVSRVSNVCLEEGLFEVRRVEWLSITEKISNFYKQGDDAVKNKNFITRIFFSIREFVFSPYTLRFLYKEDQENRVQNNFCAYSNEDLEKLTGIIGPVSMYDISSSGSRVYIDKECIIEKAKQDKNKPVGDI